jgi:formylglycine-generating enzyme required for sulfatase activity
MRRSRCLRIAPLVVLLLGGCRRTTAPATPAPPIITTTSGVEMVLLPGGAFVMGSDAADQVDERPHTVHVDAFYIDRREVTQEHYRKVCGKNPSRHKGEANPVEQIRWTDAIAYCNARSRLEGLRPCYDLKTFACDFDANGYRLPTEAEWEYAARAGTTTRYCFGNDPARLVDYAWYKENQTLGPRPVGGRRASPWGLFDMYGNVWEWCNDIYKEDYYSRSPPRNPRGPAKGDRRVLRGGCWNSKPDECRSSYRLDEIPAFTDVCFGKAVSGFVGIRCVRRRETGDRGTGYRETGRP